jgi:hypothetical protein
MSLGNLNVIAVFVAELARLLQEHLGKIELVCESAVRCRGV